MCYPLKVIVKSLTGWTWRMAGFVEEKVHNDIVSFFLLFGSGLVHTFANLLLLDWETMTNPSFAPWILLGLSMSISFSSFSYIFLSYYFLLIKIPLNVG